MYFQRVFQSFKSTVLLVCIWWASAGISQAQSIQLVLLGASPPELASNIRSASALLSLKNPGATSADDLMTLARADYARIVAALYDRSYYSGTVQIQADGQEVALLDPFQTVQSISEIVISVDPNRAFTFGQIRVGPLAPGAVLPEGLVDGAPAFADVIRAATQQAGEDWRAAGHAMVDVSSVDIVAQHRTARLDVNVQLVPGPLVVFGDVILSGETAVRPERIERIMGIPKGDRYDPAIIAAAAARLRKTGVFKSVSVREAETLSPGNSLNILVSAVDRKPRRIGVGLEASTTDGGTFSAFWLHRNLFGRADRLTIDAEASQLFYGGLEPDYKLSFRVARPAAFGPFSTVYFNGEFRLLAEPAFKSKDAFLTFGASRQKREDLIYGAELGLQYSQVTDRTAVPNTDQRFLVASLGLNATLDKRDDPLDAKTGYFLGAQLKPFHEFEYGNSGTQLELDGRFYVPVGAREDLTFALRGVAKTTVGLPHGETPTNYLFYSGGAGSVRGQGYQSLGGASGTASLGGQAFAGLSSELRWSVTDSIGLVSFVDVGFVGQNGFKQGQSHMGAGLGVRYKTPLGPIRFDIAAPVDGPGGDGVQLYLGIGQSF